MERKLYRHEFDKTVAGVCSGLAAYLNIDVTLVRVAFLALAILKGGGLLIYIVLWIVLPVKRYADEGHVDYVVGEEGQARPVYPPPLRRKNDPGATIGGMILIVIGAYFLLDDFDIIPEWFHLWQFWPMVLIGIGLVLILKSGATKRNTGWEQTGWDKRQPEAPGQNTADNQQHTNTNPPTEQL